MRMIDADALLEQMQPVSTFKINSYADAAAMTIANAYIKLVENQPTVEAPDINVGNMDTTTHDSIPAETGKNDGDGTSGDCISRQQAIDALCKSECGWNNAECRNKDDTDFYVTCDNVKIIKSLPSAQPEIIRCKDCKYYKFGICMKIGANKSFYGFCDWAERGEQDE